jgi:aminoglycoside 6'-N-acetyltransferase
MAAADLQYVASWLREPHVVRCWLPDTTAEAELEKMSERVSGIGDQATRTLTIFERRPDERDGASRVGWCQWYPYDAYPAEADALGAHDGDCGIDYAIGDLAAVGRGLGTELVAALVTEIRRHRPGCGVIVDPDARNTASRRVLEHNGFSLIAVRRVASELNDNPVAIYCLNGSADRTS